ncbi:hypothetical protein ABPG74_007495 [Tetrahymena malaccensis]
MFKAKYYPYFIVFCVLFGIDKFITLVVINRRNLLFLLFDTFQIGFLYLIIFKDLPFNVQYARILCLYVRIFPLLLSQLIIFFGCGYLKKEDVEEFNQIIAYLIFFLSLLFVVILTTQNNRILVSRKNWKQILPQFLNYILSITSYYISISSLIQFNDKQGNNIGCCYLTVLIANLLFFLFYSPPFELIINAIYYVVDQFVVCTFYNIYSHEEIKQQASKAPLYKSSMIIQYLNALIRLILLLSYGIPIEKRHFLNKNHGHKHLGDKIKFINFILATSLSILYLIYFLPQFYSFIFRVKIFILKRMKDIQSLVKVLQKRNQQIIVLYIDIAKQKGQFESKKLQEALLEHGFCSEQCKHLYDLQIELAYWLNRQTIVKSNISEYFCICLCEKVVSKIQTVHFSITNCIISYIRQRKINPDVVLNYRYFNGFLLDQLTITIEKIFKEDLEQSTLMIKSSILQILIFEKNLKQFIPLLPSQVLYDLYD